MCERQGADYWNWLKLTDKNWQRLKMFNSILSVYSPYLLRELPLKYGEGTENCQSLLVTLKLSIFLHVPKKVRMIEKDWKLLAFWRKKIVRISDSLTVTLLHRIYRFISSLEVWLYALSLIQSQHDWFDSQIKKKCDIF